MFFLVSMFYQPKMALNMFLFPTIFPSFQHAISIDVFKSEVDQFLDFKKFFPVKIQLFMEIPSPDIASRFHIRPHLLPPSTLEACLQHAASSTLSFGTWTPQEAASQDSKSWSKYLFLSSTYYLHPQKGTVAMTFSGWDVIHPDSFGASCNGKSAPG